MKYLGILLMVVGMVGCTTVTPTPPPATVTPMALPSEPSATATPSPTLAPTLSPQDIGIEMTVERDLLAADGKSQMQVQVEIFPPSGSRLDLNGQYLFFIAEGGGQFLSPSAQIQNNRAASMYQSGFAEATQTVTLRASIDVFQIGRVEVIHEITIQNEQVVVIFPPECGYVARYDSQTSGLLLPFRLQTNFPNLGGQYGLRFNVENGLLGATDADSKSVFFTHTATTGDNALYFQFPPDQPSGASPICVGVADKDNIPTQCTAVLWGSGARAWSRFIRVEDFVGYFVEGSNVAPNINIRLGTIGSTDPFTYFGVAYDVVWSWDEAIAGAMFSLPSSEPIIPNFCQIHRAVSGNVEPLTLFLDKSIQTPHIIQWRASAVGRDNPLTWVDYTVVASHVFKPLNNTLTVELTDGSTLTFLQNGFDPEFALFALSPDDANNPFVDVVVRIDVSLSQIDSTNGVIMADGEGGVDARSSGETFIGRNMRLTLANPTLPIAVIGAVQGEAWQSVYLVGKVAKEGVVRQDG